MSILTHVSRSGSPSCWGVCCTSPTHLTSVVRRHSARGSSRHVSRSVSLYCLPRPSPEMSCSRKNAILVDGPRPGVPGRSGLVRSEDGAHRRGGALGPARPAQQPKRGLSSGHRCHRTGRRSMPRPRVSIAKSLRSRTNKGERSLALSS